MKFIRDLLLWTAGYNCGWFQNVLRKSDNTTLKDSFPTENFKRPEQFPLSWISQQAGSLQEELLLSLRFLENMEWLHFSQMIENYVKLGFLPRREEGKGREKFKA